MASNERIRRFIDTLFADAPQNKNINELKEEIFLNLTDKYDDFITEGKSDEVAYNLTVASVGNINELIRSMGHSSSSYEVNQQLTAERDQQRQKSATLSAVSVCMYILSLIPLIVYRVRRDGLVAMIVIIAIATALMIYNLASRPKNEKYKGSSILEAIDNWQRGVKNRRKLLGVIVSVMWLLTVIVYFVFSFVTGLWHITWLIFVIASIFNIIISYILK